MQHQMKKQMDPVKKQMGERATSNTFKYLSSLTPFFGSPVLPLDLTFEVFNLLITDIS
jgi:hypothetical protein